MISTDFAPNERMHDAVMSLRLLVQPWKWKKGSALNKVKRRLKTLFFPTNPNIYLFLTGRCTLYHIIKALQLPKNSEILIQGFTCEAVVLPILANKYKPVYVDITSLDYSMELADLGKKWNENCKVLILQHTFGITPQNRKEILAFAKKQKLFVIEDVAHGFDSALFQKKVSTTLLMSFGRSKSFSSVFGGAVITNDKTVSTYMAEVEKLLPMPSFMFLLTLIMYKPFSLLVKSTYAFGIGKIIHLILRHTNMVIPEITKKEKDGTYDLYLSKSYPNVAAQLLLEQLRIYNDVSEKRRGDCAFYTENLEQNPALKSFGLIRYPFETEYRNKLVTQLRKKNIYLGTWYDQVVAPRQLQIKKVGYRKGSCPNAELICERVLNLPTNIPRKQADIIVKSVLKP